MIDQDMIFGDRARQYGKKNLAGIVCELSRKFSGITSESSCGKIVGLGKEDKDKLSGMAKLVTNKNGKVEDNTPWEKGGRKNMSC